MAKKKALTEGEVKSQNLKSVRAWIKKNDSRVKAKPNKTVLYSGRDYDIENLIGKNLPDVDRDTFMGTPMYKRLTDKKYLKDHKIPSDFEDITVVLKRLKSPIIVDKDRIDIPFSNANECFSNLKHKPDLFPKPEVEKVWSSLSEIFASNAQGDIRVLDGASDDFTKLREDKDFLRKELKALLKNENLSKKGKEVLSKLISKYGSYFDRRHKELLKQVESGKKHFKKRKAP